MKNSYGSDLDILFGKYLSGEALPEEAMIIDDWINEPGNKEEFTAIVKIWNAVNGTPAYEKPLLTSEWLIVKERLMHKKAARRFAFLKHPYAIAATTLIIVICSAIIFFTQQGNSFFRDKRYVTLQSVNNSLWDTLPDGSTIVMNRNSMINYEKNFNTNERQLSLKGESYFTVMPNKSKPFIINMDDLKIKVVGTAFNVKKQDHPRSIEVQVQSGIVKMYTNKKEIIVNKGQTGIYSGNGQLTIKEGVDNNSMSYATRNFSFNDMSLAEINECLENAFSVSIISDKEKLLQCRMTASFQNESLRYILDVIAVTLNINYSINRNKIHINGQGCN